MPRYDFRCDACGTVQEHSFRMADKPPTVPCSCGGVAETVFSADVEMFVMGRDIPFTHPVAVPGWEKGNTDVRGTEKLYGQAIDRAAKEQRSIKRSLGKKPIMQRRASIPIPLFKARQRQFGKNYWSEEGKKALRRDGLLIE